MSLFCSRYIRENFILYENSSVLFSNIFSTMNLDSLSSAFNIYCFGKAIFEIVKVSPMFGL